MDDIIFYSIWIIGAIISSLVFFRAFSCERHNPRTDLTYGLTILISVACLIPFVNLVVAFSIYQSFTSYFSTSGWWTKRSVYVGPKQSEGEE